MKQDDGVMLGINLTTCRQMGIVDSFKTNGSIDFVELLMDNFFHCDPGTIRPAFGDIPVAFHIMGSHFLERPANEMVEIGKIYRSFIQVVRPIYVSDHLARFGHDGLPLPILAELDYPRALANAVERTRQWQDLLDSTVLLENFPSVMSDGACQPGFFAELIRATGCGLLFDVSNALVAAKNTGTRMEAWEEAVGQFNHFHAAGFDLQCFKGREFYLDSHDRALAPESMDWVIRLASRDRPGPRTTVVIEFDDQIDVGAWQQDLRDLRRRLGPDRSPA